MTTMICSTCNGVVEWVGPLSAPTGTRCTGCGTLNNQRVAEGEDEGDLCGRDGCCGRLELRAAQGSEGCTCFIAPPCGHCMSTVPECPDCGWRAEEP